MGAQHACSLSPAEAACSFGALAIDHPQAAVVQISLDKHFQQESRLQGVHRRLSAHDGQVSSRWNLRFN
jgi:hypothetical protein